MPDDWWKEIEREAMRIAEGTGRFTSAGLTEHGLALVTLREAVLRRDRRIHELEAKLAQPSTRGRDLT